VGLGSCWFESSPGHGSTRLPGSRRAPCSPLAAENHPEQVTSEVLSLFILSIAEGRSEGRVEGIILSSAGGTKYVVSIYNAK
jgi:hypothetical protein